MPRTAGERSRTRRRSERDARSGPGRLPGSQAHHLIEADRQASATNHTTHAQQDAGHEGHAVERIGADDQLLARVAQKDLLRGGQAAQAHGMHRNTVDATTATTELVGLGCVGHRAQARLGARLRDAACGRHGGARGGIHLGG